MDEFDCERCIIKCVYRHEIMRCTSRRGDLFHNQQLGRTEGENSVHHCHQGPVG